MNSMKIFNVEQIRRLDAYSIANEPVLSIELMERASLSFVKWFTTYFDSKNPIRILVGLGNNGEMVLRLHGYWQMRIIR